MAARNDSVSLISPRRVCAFLYLSICGRKERNWRAERAINANLVISVAPTVSHGRNKYPLATVKTSTIAPTVYHPSRHFITVSPARILPPSPFPRPSRSNMYRDGCPVDFTRYRPVLTVRGEKNGDYMEGYYFFSFYRGGRN